jgi:hypothetical protein
VARRVEKAQLVGTDSRGTKHGQLELTEHPPKMAITQNGEPSTADEETNDACGHGVDAHWPIR